MKSLGIYIGPYVHDWDENDVKSGIGGSETWAYEVALRLSRYYKVTVYAQPRENHNINDNLEWLHYDEYHNDIKCGKYFDYFIFSRTAAPISAFLNCNKVYLMLHDIGLLEGNDLLINRVRYVACLSEWHADYVCGVYNYPKDRIKFVTNGFSREFYNEPLRKINRIVWSSEPARGFFETYQMVFFPLIKKIPDLRIEMCYANKIYPSDELMERAKRLPKVDVLDTLSKRDLAKHQLRAKAWVYPGYFSETFCITSIENAMAGNALIFGDTYALTTTLKGYPWRLGPLDESNAHEYIELTERCLLDDEFRSQMEAESRKIAAQYSWERAAMDWIKIFNDNNLPESAL